MNVFAGMKDVRHAVSEKRLLKYLGKSNIEKHVKDALRTEASENSALWHRYGGASYFFVGILVGFATYKTQFFCATSLAVIIWLIRLVVFNPIIAVGLKQPFYYLGSGPFDSFFKKYLGEKLTFIMSLSLVIALTAFLANRCYG